MVGEQSVIPPNSTSTEDGRCVQGEFALGEFWASEADQVARARVLAGELDLNHAPEPGGLEDIGTCRRCGFIIAEDDQGVWHHWPSVGEIDDGQAWLDRNSTWQRS